MTDARNVNDKETEMIEHIDVNKAMQPLDVVVDRIKSVRVRDEDKAEIDSAVEEVKKGIKEGIIHDIAAALGTTSSDVVEVKPAAVRPAPKKGGKKATSKKVEPVATPEKVTTPKKGSGKKLPLDTKGLVKPVETVVAPVKANIAKERAKAASKVAPKAEVKTSTPNESLRGTSTALKPTKLVWAIAEEISKKNPKATRKDILEACAAAGITHYTARTQYQLWRSSKGGK